MINFSMIFPGEDYFSAFIYCLQNFMYDLGATGLPLQTTSVYISMPVVVHVQYQRVNQEDIHIVIVHILSRMN